MTVQKIERTRNEDNSFKYFGKHIILEMYDGRGFSDISFIEQKMINSLHDSNATLLKIYSHRFQPCGVTCFAMLAESHISVHTWPEEKYAAFDIFMCGKADPLKCAKTLERSFLPKKTHLIEVKRGFDLPEKRLIRSSHSEERGINN